MFGLFGGEDGGFSDEDRRLQSLLNEYRNLATPTYREAISENYSPETSNYKLMSEDPVTKSMQLQALQKMAGLSESGLSAEDEAAFAKARSLGAKSSRAGAQAAMQDAQARGVGGSGLEFAMREIANQGGANRAQEAGLERAATAARQRALAQQAYMQGLSGMRDQDYRTNAANTNVINQFNQANTQARNQAALQNINSRADARTENNQLADRRFNNQLNRMNGISGIQQQINQVNSARDAQRRRQQGGLMGIAGAGIGALAGGPTGAQVGYGVGSTMGENLW